MGIKVKENTRPSIAKKFYKKLTTEKKLELIKNKKSIKNPLKPTICFRYTQLKYCACKNSFCKIPSKIIKINKNIFISKLPSVFHAKNLQNLKIKNILNLTSSQFTKNSHFNYKSFSFKENRNQNFMNFFRNSNRFIKMGNEEEKILVISNTLELAVVFVIAFFLYSQKNSLVEIIERVNFVLEENGVFDFFITEFNLNQLKVYEKKRDDFNQEKDK